MKKRVLIIDDDQMIRKMLTFLMNSKGFIVDEAVDGIKGLEHLKKVDVPRPDLILLDLMMPEMDGFTVCREIKSHPELKDIPIIALTVLSTYEYSDEMMRLGAAGYVEKTARMEDLKKSIDTVLAKSISSEGSGI